MDCCFRRLSLMLRSISANSAPGASPHPAEHRAVARCSSTLPLKGRVGVRPRPGGWCESAFAGTTPSESTRQCFARLLRALAVVRVEQLFAEPDRLGRHLDELVVLD